MQQLYKTIQDIEQALRAIGDISRARKLTDLRQFLSESALHIVVFGEFNHGKSTLINALLGRIVLPTKLIPTTGHITQVVYGTLEEVRVYFLDSHSEVCRLDQLDTFSSLNQNGIAREDVEIIQVSVNVPLLKNQLVITDTPGLNDHDAQTHRAIKAIAKADLVFLVLNAQQLLNNNERSLASEWLNHKLGKPIIPIVNFMNRLEESDKKEVRTRLQTWCHDNLSTEFGQPWFEINALGNLKHIIYKENPAPNDDFEYLKKSLMTLTSNRKRDLQSRARYSQLLAETHDIAEENKTALELLEINVAKVEYERTLLKQDLQIQYLRFEADSAILREDLKLSIKNLLDSHLNTLLNNKFMHKNKETLETNATKWYKQNLSLSIREIEKESQNLLNKLAGENLRHPDPLMIQERMTLNTRLAIGELPLNSPSDSAIGWGAGVGAVIGTFLIPVPVIGTSIGWLIGGVLTNILGSSQPNYSVAYAKQAREAWAIDSQNVVNIATKQLDTRIIELKNEILEQLEEVTTLLTLPPSEELEQRTKLDILVDNCYQELQSVLMRRNK